VFAVHIIGFPHLQFLLMVLAW